MKEFTSNGECVCYIRVSTDEQTISGLGLQAQGDACAVEAARLGLKFRQDVFFDLSKRPRPGHFVDPAVSAYKITLSKRPAGKLLMQTLRPGDTVIVARLDRMFRSMRDFLGSMDDFELKGVRFVSCSPRIDLGTANGRMLARHIASAAEWESDRRSERVRAALEVKKRRRIPQIHGTHLDDKPVDIPTLWTPILDRVQESYGQYGIGRIHLYARCSHRTSANAGWGMIVQIEQAKKFAMLLIERNPALTLGGIFEDFRVSARFRPLTSRYAGNSLNRQLLPGDHVVFPSLDRGFRNTLDMITTCTEWQKRGCHVHFANEGISYDDPSGKMMSNICSQFAEMESELISQRNKEARAVMVASGKYPGGVVRHFWRLVHDKELNVRYLALDKEQLAVYRLMRIYTNHMKMRISQAAIKIESIIAKRYQRPEISVAGRMLTQRTRKHFYDPYGQPRCCIILKNWVHRPYDAQFVVEFANDYERAMEAWRLYRKELRDLQDHYLPQPLNLTSKRYIRGQTHCTALAFWDSVAGRELREKRRKRPANG